MKNPIGAAAFFKKAGSDEISNINRVLDCIELGERLVPSRSFSTPPPSEGGRNERGEQMSERGEGMGRGEMREVRGERGEWMSERGRGDER